MHTVCTSGLEMWDEIVTCYIMSSRPKKAEKVVRAQLEREARPKLLCILGDLTEDPGGSERARV